MQQLFDSEDADDDILLLDRKKHTKPAEQINLFLLKGRLWKYSCYSISSGHLCREGAQLVQSAWKEELRIPEQLQSLPGIH